jgi:hypothetical protein
MRAFRLRAQSEGMKRALITVFGAAVVASAGFGAGAAHADTMEPHRWCPGNPKHMPYVVNQDIDWDWNICHTWYPTVYGKGNLTEQVDRSPSCAPERIGQRARRHIGHRVGPPGTTSSPVTSKPNRS